jgi:hypothetical protein
MVRYSALQRARHTRSSAEVAPILPPPPPLPAEPKPGRCHDLLLLLAILFPLLVAGAILFALYEKGVLFGSSSSSNVLSASSSTGGGGLVVTLTPASSSSSSFSPSSTPSLATVWANGGTCPQVLGQNDRARRSNSLCWVLEMFTLYAAHLQTQSALRGTPAMEGNWSTLVSGLVQQWITANGVSGSCDDNPMIYPLLATASATAATQPQAGGQHALMLYVDASAGSDSSGTGAIGNPFATPQHALAVSRLRTVGNPAAIILRAGSYYATQTIALDQAVDSGLTIMAQPDEVVTLWGGAPFTPTWSAATVPSGAQGVYSTPIPSSVNVSWAAFNELMVNGVRQTRARWPDGDSWTNLMGDATWAVPGLTFTALASWPVATEAFIPDVRNTSFFTDYQMAFQGSATPYVNHQNYWAQPAPEDGETCGQFSAMTYTPGSFSPRVSSWSDVGNTYMHARQYAGWGSWQFQLAGLDTGTSTVSFAAGGFQEARGAWTAPASNQAAFFDNQLAELDAPGEYFVDVSARVLYWLPDAGVALPTPIVPSQVDTLIHVSGGVQNVALQGLTLTHTANTFMAPHMASGGGDWASPLQAAVRITDCNNCSVTYCLFTQLGGNAVVVDGSSNGTLVAYNEVSFVGGNGVAVMGVMLSYNASLEWTQPRDTQIVSNLMHDVGKYNKGSGGVYSTLAWRTVVQGCVIVTTPRSGVNFNDGFAGGHVFAYNLMINTAQETQDVGPYNSWNRVAYWTAEYGWNTSLSYNHHNLILVDNNSPGIDHAALNHDDGSTAFVNSFNVLVNSRTKLSLGTNITYANNFLLPQSGDSCYWIVTSASECAHVNNTCMQLNLAASGPYQGYAYDFSYDSNGCDASDLGFGFPVTHNNTYYLSPAYNNSVQAVANCNASYSLAQLQALSPGFAEPGSHALSSPQAYPYYRYIAPGILNLASDPCFSNPRNAVFNASGARARFTMPLLTNLTELMTGHKGINMYLGPNSIPAPDTANNASFLVAPTSTTGSTAYKGVGDLVYLPPVIGFLAQSYSESFWTYVPDSGPAVFISSAATGTVNTYFTTLTYGLLLYFSHGASGAPLASYQLTQGAAINAWFHVGVTFNASTLVASLYVNGALVNTTTHAPLWLGTSRMQMGFINGAGFPSQPFQGWMRWLVWATYEMSATEILNAYTSTPLT